MTKKTLILAMVLCLACAYNAQARLETFDTGLGYFNLEVGNRSGGQNWGFSNTNHAGGTAGELGGTFQRTDTFPHVVDGTIGEFPLESNLVLKGRVVMQDINWDGGINIGYFKQGVKSMKIGLSLGEPKGAGPRIFIQVGNSGALATTVPWGQPFTFDLTYENGTLSGTVNGVSGSISGNPGEVDAFGVAVQTLSSSTQKIKVYFDNLEYTGGPQLTFANPSFSDSETVSPASIDVLLKNPVPGQTYTVDYAVTGGTATNGEDYVLEPGTLTFNPGETSKTISMPIVSDGMDEDDETVIISLSNPTGAEAMLGIPSTFTYTIIDPRSLVQFAADLGDGPVQAGWVVMPACGEYTDVGGSGIDVTLETGDPGPCEPRNPDWGLTGSGPLADVEKDLLWADNRAGADADFIITFTGLTAGTRYQLESYHTRTGNQNAVPIAAVTITGGIGVMTPGPIAQTRDTMDNPAQTQFTATGTSVTVRFVAASNGMVQVNGFVLRMDSRPQVQFASSVSSGFETESPANLPVVVLSPAQPNVVTVDYAATGGTAANGEDYILEPGTLTFNPGEISKTISMAIINDDVGENDETIVVTLSNPIGGEVKLGSVTTLTYTINDQPVVGFESDSTLAVMEDLGLIMVTVKLSYSYKETITVDYAAIGGTATAGDDYIMTPGTLTFATGETSKTISIELVDDRVLEDPETVVIELSNPTNAALGSIQQHTVNIRDPLHLKVDLALPMWGTRDPWPGTAKEGWWPFIAGRWADMYAHDCVWECDGQCPDGIDGTGVHAMLSCGYEGQAGLHAKDLCRCNLAGDCPPSGTIQGDPIANTWLYAVDWAGSQSGDIVLVFTDLRPGEYSLISYHNHWEPGPGQGSRNCCRCMSPMPPMPSITAQPLPVGPGCKPPGKDRYRGLCVCGTGTGVEAIENAYNVPVTYTYSDDEVSMSVISFRTNGSEVLVIYEAPNLGFPDCARSGREGGRAILNAFELKAILPPPVCTCLGDLAAPAGQVDLQDLDAMVNMLVAAGPPFIVPVEFGHCGDMAEPYLQVDLQDLDDMVNLLVSAGPPFIVPCE